MIKNCPDNETDIATLREVEERWRLALEAAGDGVWDWNLQTGEAWYSLPYKAMLGFSGDEIEIQPKNGRAAFTLKTCRG